MRSPARPTDSPDTDRSRSGLRGLEHGHFLLIVHLESHSIPQIAAVRADPFEKMVILLGFRRESQFQFALVITRSLEINMIGESLVTVVTELEVTRQFGAQKSADRAPQQHREKLNQPRGNASTLDDETTASGSILHGNLAQQFIGGRE